MKNLAGQPAYSKALSKELYRKEMSEEDKKRKAEFDANIERAWKDRVLFEYERLGVEPVYCSGMLVSPALLESLGLPIPKGADE